MKIEKLIQETPEVTEDKLLEVIKAQLPLVKKNIRERIKSLHKDVDLCQAFLNEYDLIQDKKSYLTKSQRDQVVGFVGLCMIQMVKGNDKDKI